MQQENQSIMLGELRQGQTDMNRRLLDIERSLDDLKNTFASASGGFRTLVGVGSAAAAIAAAMAEFFHWIHK